MNSQSNDDKLLTIIKAADLLSVDPQTLRRWDNKGLLKAIRVGSRKDRRYKLSDILLYMNNHADQE